MKHFLSTVDLEKDTILHLLERAEFFEPYAKKEKFGDMMKGKVLAALFYEPSTRTRLSHEAAMIRMGGQVISVTDLKTSSLAKGETLSDTHEMIARYADIAAIRHPQVGAADDFAKNSRIPVINAGDGAGQHPTQAMLDLLTIKKERGELDGLTVGLAGDLKYGRTPNSLTTVLSHFDVSFKFIAPDELKMKDEVKQMLDEKGKSYEETDDFEAALSGLDVLYMTRIQGERFEDKAEYERLKNVFVLTRELVERANKDMTIMHPLPRVGEIAEDVDALPTAAYFRQVENGVAIRMAIIEMLLS